MGEDLELTVGSRYTIALVVFFIPYIFFEVRQGYIALLCRWNFDRLLLVAVKYCVASSW